jgi:nucleoside-diphosphate-sugar epimerase
MVLVTGGTGFLGGYIIQNLVAKGLPVRALRRSDVMPFGMPTATWQAVEWVDSDVLDVVGLDDAMKGCWGVVHAAALVSFKSREHRLMEEVNVEGTRNVVNLAIENGIGRFIHISSVAALGRGPEATLVSEEKSWETNRSTTHYALTKHEAELEVWRGFSEELKGVILNPSTILGYGDWHRSSCAIFRNSFNEFPWYTEGVNGFVGVEDTAEAAVQCLLSTITEKRYVVNGENWSFERLLTSIAEGFHKKPPHRKAGPLLGALAWRVERIKHLLGGREPLLTRETAMVAQSKRGFDNRALLRDLPGFGFTPLETVIRNSCEKYSTALQRGQITP